MGLRNDIARFINRRSAKIGSGVAPKSVRQGGTAPWIVVAGGQMAVATVYRCVKLLSESVAQLELRHMTKKRGLWRAEADELADLLAVSPDGVHSSFDYWAHVVQQLLVQGNAYIVPVYGFKDGRPVITSLVLVDSGKCTHDTTTDTYTVRGMGAIDGVYGEADIIHIKGMSELDSKTGVSVLTYARMAITVAQTAEAETLDRFRHGGIRGIVGNDRTLRGIGKNQDEQLKFTAMDVDERLSQGQRVIHMPGMVDFKQLAMSSADLQFLESRKFQVRDICRFFGVHPSFVFDDTSNNYKSAEMANAAFLSNTLNPILRKIEIELQRKLVAQRNWGKERFEFDRSGLYACDLESRINYLTKLQAAGMATVNELRIKEGHEPVDGGDTVLVSANLKTIQELTAPQGAIKNNDGN